MVRSLSPLKLLQKFWRFRNGEKRSDAVSVGRRLEARTSRKGTEFNPDPGAGSDRPTLNVGGATGGTF